jgi:hypothetical protein
MEEHGQTRIFETKVFARLCKAEGVSLSRLVQCVTEAEAGLIEADLGRGLIKQRIARAGQGKSGGLRAVLVFRKGKRAVFLYLFAKSALANISSKELEGYQKLAGIYLKLTDEQIDQALRAGQLIEIKRGEESHG